MIKQEWILCQGKRICAVTSNVDVDRSYSAGIIFFYFFSQTKAGAYGLFSQICESLDRDVPTLRFDYIGFGDSEGETSQADFNTMVKDAEEMTGWFVNKICCSKIIYIGHGVGNYIATMLAEKNPTSEAILIMPQLKALNKEEKYRDIIKKIEFAEEYTDTSSLSLWNKKMDDFFALLGGRMNRSKGIVVKREFLKEMIAFDIEDHCLYPENIKLLMNKDGDLTNISMNILNDYELHDVLLLDMLEREKVIKTICEYRW